MIGGLLMEQLDEIDKYDAVMDAIELEDIKELVRDQIRMPGESVSNYLKSALDRMDKEEKIGFCRELSYLFEESYPIKFEEDAREDWKLVYNTYKLLIENILSGFSIFISQYLYDFSKKKSFVKTYSNIKSPKALKPMSRECYIVLTNCHNIIDDIINLGVHISTFLEYLDKGDQYTMPRYMQDAFESNKLSDEGLVKKIYNILDERGLLEVTITKVLIDYNNKYGGNKSVIFNTEEAEIEDEQLEEDYNDED